MEDYHQERLERRHLRLLMLLMRHLPTQLSLFMTRTLSVVIHRLGNGLHMALRGNMKNLQLINLSQIRRIIHIM